MTRFQQHGFYLTLAVCLAIFAAGINEVGVIQGWQHDLAVGLSARPAASDVVIVAIDERSLEQLGRWPWSRSIHARLLDKLTDAGVKAVAMDIFFIEAEQDNPNADAQLANALRRNGGVVLPLILDQNDAGGLSLTPPLAQFASVAAGLGHVNMHPEADGVLRGVYLQAATDGLHFPVLAQALLNVKQQPNSNSPPRPSDCIAETLQMCDYRLIMSFPESAEHFKKISYVDVLLDERVSQSLRGKLVFVGMTAYGLAPRFTVPSFNRSLSLFGVEFNANTLKALQNGFAIAPLDARWRMLITFALVFVPVTLYGLLRSGGVMLTIMVFSTLSLAMSWGFLKLFSLWYGSMTPVVFLLISYPLWSWQQHKIAARTLFREKESVNTTLHAIGDAVIMTDVQGFIQFMNPVAEEMTGYSLKQVQGQPIESIVLLKNDEQRDMFPAIRQSLAVDNNISMSKPQSLINRHHQEYEVRIVANTVRASSGQITGMVFALSDIGEIVAMSNKMTHLATHDTLTQLPNRTLLQDRLTTAIQKAERRNTQFAVLFIDLDGFKKINDNQGHNIGDLLLQEVAVRLISCQRKTDTVARWGGDEFVILLEELPQDTIIIDISNAIIQVLGKPFNLQEHTLFVSPSIGISLYPKDSRIADELLEKADIAMYQVKKTGRNNFCFYSPDLSKPVLGTALPRL